MKYTNLTPEPALVPIRALVKGDYFLWQDIVFRLRGEQRTGSGFFEATAFGDDSIAPDAVFSTSDMVYPVDLVELTFTLGVPS